MSIYVVLVPLWIFWNLLPFLLIGWLWNDQAKHQKLIATVAILSMLYFLWAYLTFQNPVITAPMTPVIIVFIVSTYLALHNHFDAKAHNKKLKFTSAKKAWPSLGRRKKRGAP